MKTATTVCILLSLFAIAEGRSQRERQIVAPEPEIEYGSQFFGQLSSIFGRFQDADLDRVFQGAHPIPCSELVADKGEWREVAFFNENRTLGAWYRRNLAEVKNDLAVFLFKGTGTCAGADVGALLTTKFPVQESLDAYTAGKLPLEKVEVNVNFPVKASYDAQKQSYVFDLPYLFHISGNLYSLTPPRLTDRYAANVANHWECKSVVADDVTYRFIICRTTLVRWGSNSTRLPWEGAGALKEGTPAFGSSAYFILSDGREASSTVKLSIGGPAISLSPATSVTPVTSVTIDGPAAVIAPASVEPLARIPDPPPPAAIVKTWRQASPDLRFSAIAQGEYRLRLLPEAWQDRISQAQFIAAGRITPFNGAGLPNSRSLCVWEPGPRDLAQRLPAAPIDSVRSTLEFSNAKAGSDFSARFQLKDGDGAALGTLQCYFPHALSPTEVTVGQWMSIVGSGMALEVRE